MSLSTTEEYLSVEVEKLTETLAERNRQLMATRQIVQNLETVIHKAAKIAGHLPFLCAEMPEISGELEQAALQLQQILVERRT